MQGPIACVLGLLKRSLLDIPASISKGVKKEERVKGKRRKKL
jgi:hypothetical protein